MNHKQQLIYPSTASTEELTGPTVDVMVIVGNTRSRFTYL